MQVFFALKHSPTKIRTSCLLLFLLLHVNCWMELSIFDSHFYHLQLVVKGAGELLMSAQMFNNG